MKLFNQSYKIISLHSNNENFRAIILLIVKQETFYANEHNIF